MTGPFPFEGRLIHVAHEGQWNGIVALLNEYGVRMFEIPPGPSVPDLSEVPTYGLMFNSSDADD